MPHGLPMAGRLQHVSHICATPRMLVLRPGLSSAAVRWQCMPGLSSSLMVAVVSRQETRSPHRDLWLFGIGPTEGTLFKCRTYESSYVIITGWCGDMNVQCALQYSIPCFRNAFQVCRSTRLKRTRTHKPSVFPYLRLAVASHCPAP